MGSASDEITGSVEGMGAELVTAIWMSPKDNFVTVDDLEDELLQSENIKAVASTAGGGNATLKVGTEVIDASVTGVTSNYALMQEQELQTGRFLSDLDIELNTNKVVIDYDTAIELFGSEYCIDSSMSIDGEEFEVVGVLKQSENSMGAGNERVINIPISTAQRMFQNTELSTIIVQASSAEVVEAAAEDLKVYSKRVIKDSDYFFVYSNADVLDILDDITGILSAVFGGIASISLLVGGIGIMNIMLVSVTERTREIGVRKAIGAKKMDILVQFVIEAVVLCVMGGIIGLLLGYAGVAIAGQAMNMAITISMSTISLALGFSIVVGLAFGIYPANKASNLRPIEALRYE